ncbi:MAG: response regulator [bacterium]|nr:response regulator [bacterium]
MNFKEKQLNILVVDDNPDNLRLLAEYLSRMGYRIRVARNGSRAYATIEKELPDLILLDIWMPGIDGYEVCRWLKDSDRTRNIPIIFLSTVNDMDHMALAPGGADYIYKPFMADEVLTCVSKYL